jgi:hypothetical protein
MLEEQSLVTALPLRGKRPPPCCAFTEYQNVADLTQAVCDEILAELEEGPCRRRLSNLLNERHNEPTSGFTTGEQIDINAVLARRQFGGMWLRLATVSTGLSQVWDCKK